ncbi:MAG: hypothetical protein NTW08_06900 [Gammaproteobacteria bacterium]|nr:hypothetical protein [Gammaproteobacteria bacterium]
MGKRTPISSPTQTALSTDQARFPAQQPLAPATYSAILDSCIAADILKNPSAFVATTTKVLANIQPIWQNLYQKFMALDLNHLKPEDQAIINFVYKVIYDTSMPGQFETIGPEQRFDIKQLQVGSLNLEHINLLKQRATEFNQFVASSTQNQDDFAKKTLAIKCIGGALTDYPASIQHLDDDIMSPQKKSEILSVAKKVKPEGFFNNPAYRGRQGERERVQSSSIGILTDEAVHTLPEAIQERLQHHQSFQKISFDINEHANGFNLAQQLGQFASASGASGSVSVMLVALAAAEQTTPLTPEEYQQFALSCSSFLVGGGYHSLFECLGMFHYAKQDELTLGVGKSANDGELQAHKQDELEHFLSTYDTFMPYHFESGVVWLNEAQFPAAFQPQLQALQHDLSENAPLVQTVDLADLYLGQRFLKEFNRCCDYALMNRRTRHVDPNLIQHLTIIGAKLVQVGALKREDLIKKLDYVVEPYPADKTSRQEGNDYADEVARLNQEKRSARDLFNHLETHPEQLDEAYAALQDLPQPALDLSTQTGQLEHQVYQALSASNESPSADHTERLTDAFNHYSQQLITNKMVSHNPIALFCKMHDYLAEKQVLQAPEPVQIHAMGDLAKLNETQLIAKGLHLPIEDILKFNIQYQDSLAGAPQSTVLAHKTQQIILALLRGSAQNPAHLTLHFLTQLQTYLEQHPPQSLTDRKNILLILYQFKDKNIKVGHKNTLDLYKNQFDLYIKQCATCTDSEKIQAYHDLLQHLRANDLPHMEVYIDKMLQQLMQLDFPSNPSDRAAFNAIFKKCQELGLLSKLVQFQDEQSFAIASHLYQHYGNMYPDPELIQWIKTQSAQHDSLETTFQTLRQQFIALEQELTGLPLLEQAQKLNASPMAAKLYYLFHFADKEPYASQAYTFDLFRRDLVHAARFERDPHQAVHIKDNFNFEQFDRASPPKPEPSPLLRELDKRMKTLNSALAKNKFQLLTKKGGHGLKQANMDNLSELDFKTMRADPTYAALHELIDQVTDITTHINPAREKQKASIEVKLYPTKTNLVQAFRITDRYNSCLLTRNKRHSVNRVSFALAEETRRFAYEIIDSSKKTPVVKKGLLHCSVGFTSKDGKQIPTLFVDSPLGQDLKDYPAYFEQLMSTIEAHALNMGCERIQLFLDTKRSEHDLSGYTPTENSPYRESHITLLSSLTSEKTLPLYNVAFNDNAMHPLVEKTVQLQWKDNQLTYALMNSEGQRVTGTLTAAALHTLGIPPHLESVQLAQFDTRILYLIEKQTKLSLLETKQCSWQHGHVDWGEKMNAPIAPSSSLREQSFSRDITTVPKPVLQTKTTNTTATTVDYKQKMRDITQAAKGDEEPATKITDLRQ